MRRRRVRAGGEERAASAPTSLDVRRGLRGRAAYAAIRMIGTPPHRPLPRSLCATHLAALLRHLPAARVDGGPEGVLAAAALLLGQQAPHVFLLLAQPLRVALPDRVARGLGGGDARRLDARRLAAPLLLDELRQQLLALLRVAPRAAGGGGGGGGAVAAA